MEKKKIRRFLFLIGIILVCGIVCLILFVIRPRKEKTICLKWGIMNADSDLSIYEKSVNEKLREKALPYQIELVNISVDISKSYGEYLNEYLGALADAGIDIVSCPGVYGTYDIYAMMIQGDMLEPMNDFMDETDLGRQLYNSYPSKMWETVKDDGEIYGILTPYTNLNFYAVMNQQYYSKYIEPVDQMLADDLKAVMAEAKRRETEAGNKEFISGTYFPSSRFSEAYEYTVCRLIEVNVEKGNTAVNLLEDQEYLDWLKETNTLYLSGVLGDESTYFDRLQEGNFLSASMYSYSPEAAVKTFRSWYEISEDVGLVAVEIPELSNPLNGTGVKNGVYSGSDYKEEAMELLACIYSDADLSNALVYGEENVSYTRDEGIAQYMAEYEMSGAYMQEHFGNPFLMYPGVEDDANKGESFRQAVENAELSGLAGFHFQVDQVAKKSGELNALLARASFLDGKTENLEEDIKKLKEEAEALGISQLVDEMNRELEGFLRHEEGLEAAASTPSSEWLVNKCFIQDGILFKNPNTNWMEYYDYNTDHYQLLCAKPNCTHDTEECEAVYLAQKAYLIGRTGDRWAYYSEDDGLNGSFYSCKIDGTDEKKLGEFHHQGGSTASSRVIFYDSACILATGEDKFDEETGEWTGTFGGIYQYDLETGEENVLCEEKEYMRPAYCIYGVSGHRLIYTEWDGEKNLLKALDLENGKQELFIEEGNVLTAAISEPYVVCSAQNGQNYKLYQISMNTGEKTEIDIQGAAGWIFWTDELKIYIVYDNMAAYVYLYKEEDHTTELIMETAAALDFTPYKLVDGMLIGQTENKMAVISLEDYLNGEQNWSILEI